MKKFEYAQKLFEEYEKEADISKLRGTLEILDELIKDKDLNNYREMNLKNTICKHITSQINNLLEYITGFGKDIKADDSHDIKADNKSIKVGTTPIFLLT
jgi:hypothetical protein